MSRPTLTRALVAVALVVTGIALVATLAYAVAAVAGRPLDDVEGEVLFEAQRLRQGLPLYVDPSRGALDYGPIPARFYVLYPPCWSWLLSHVPPSGAARLARGFGAAAWFGVLAWIAAHADRGRRAAAWAAAAFAGSIFTLALFTATARPDAFGLLLTALALERSVRRGRVDGVAAALFAFAPWIKPNLIGLAAGALLAHLTAPASPAPPRGTAPPRGSRLAPVAVALAVTGAVGLLLHFASGGAMLLHLLRSTAQPLSARLWLEQMGSRLPFFAVPFGFAIVCAARARAAPGVRIALSALVASIAWSTVCLAKIGSATNYLLEPAVAAVVVFAHAPLPRFRAAMGIAALAAAQALWSGVASVRSSVEEIGERFPAEARALALARARCKAGPGDLIVADEAGTELTLDGRVVATAFQLTHLARAGLFDTQAWLADLARPEIVGAVMRTDLLDRPPTAVSVEHDRLGPGERAVLSRRLRLVARDGDWRTYCADAAP